MAGRPPRREYDGDAPGAPGGIMPLRARELVMRGSPGKVYERPVTAGGTRRKPSLKTKSQTSLRRPSTAGSTGGRTLRRPKDRATLSQQEATKHFSLSLELSDALVNFGVLKQGFRYTCSRTLTNRSASGLRWNYKRGLEDSISQSTISGDDQVSCVTPRGRLAPGVALRLAFEVVAKRPGECRASFVIQGLEDVVRTDPDRYTRSINEKTQQRLCSIPVKCTATILAPDDFKAHVLQQRFERKPLMAKGVECHGRLPASSVEVASVVDVSDDASAELDKAANDWLEGSALPQRAIDLLEGQDANVVDELAHMPFFPECVYDPATGELKIDERQQGFIVDPSRTLEEVVAEYDARNAKRMAELEGGGLLTGRCLAEFARRHLPEDKQKIVEREGLTRKDAVRKVMEGK